MPVQWTTEREQTFQNCRTSLLRAMELAQPDPRAELVVITDTSVGGEAGRSGDEAENRKRTATTGIV